MHDLKEKSNVVNPVTSSCGLLERKKNCQRAVMIERERVHGNQPQQSEKESHATHEGVHQLH